jgi:uncharacterized SAM-binding protein YcdF (DUF218 family)
VKASHSPAMNRLIRRAILVLFAAYLAGFAVFVARLPVVPPRAVRADAIVALTGSDDRLYVAVALLEHGVGQRLLISGVHPSMSKPFLRPLLHGGPRFDCCADLGFVATNTHGNAMEAAGWARMHGFHSLVVVTANYHMPRSLEEFSAAMPDIRLVPYPVPEIIAAHRWWFDPLALRTLQYEYAKYLGSVALRTVYPQHWSQPVRITRASTI